MVAARLPDSNHLIPRPDSDGEGAGAAAPQNHVGAVVERLKGWNQAAPTDPDEGGGEQLGWQLVLGTLFDPCRLAYLAYTSND